MFTHIPLNSLTNQFANIIQGGIESFKGVSDYRICSVPSIVTLALKDTSDITEEGSGRDLKLVAAASGDDFCCPPVVDSSTWLSVVGGMAIVTYFLRLQITQNLKKKRKKRSEGVNSFLLKGQLPYVM